MLTQEKIIEAGFSVMFRHGVSDIKEPVVSNLVSPVEYRDYQTEAISEIEALFRVKNVVSAEIYCGGGKTIVGGSLVAKHL